MKALIIRCSLNPGSKSNRLADAAYAHFGAEKADLISLSDYPLPLCDGGAAYGDENVAKLGDLGANAGCIILTGPIYNYDVNAAMKNMLELCGKKWGGKVVSLMVAAGGSGSLMAPLSVMNSLMLDFRCLVLPRYVYAAPEAFTEDGLAESIVPRIQQLSEQTLAVAGALEGVYQP